MSYQENFGDLDPILLRAEQSFFEKDEREINQYEQRIKADQEQYAQKHEQFIEHNKEQEKTLQLLRLQLRQAQEEIGLSNQRMNQSLQRVKDFELQTKQLNQAQEELSVALDNTRSLQDWQYIHRTSIISQLKLITKTLVHKLRNKAIWLIPLHGARKCKAILKRFI